MEDVRRVLMVESCEPSQCHDLCLGSTYCWEKGRKTLINAAVRVKSGRVGVGASGCLYVIGAGGGLEGVLMGSFFLL